MNRLKRIYNYLQSKRNTIKISSILMMGFLLSLNTYAWFIFVSQVGTEIEGNVTGWDIEFLDATTQIVETMYLNIENMQPGMDTFEKVYSVSNKSSVDAKFSYTINSITLFGEKFSVVDGDFDDTSINEILTQDFPFVINITASSSEIPKNQTITFSITADWDFEASEPYVKINKFYKYDSSFKYYKKQIDDTYTEVNITSATYNTELETDLYIEADIADSYWGEKSFVYKRDHPSVSPLLIEINIRVEQNENSND